MTNEWQKRARAAKDAERAQEIADLRALLEREQSKVVALFSLARARAKLLRAADSDYVDGDAIACEANAIEALAKLGMDREALS